MRTFGIEEEAVLVDPVSLRPASDAHEVVEALQRAPVTGDRVTTEFLNSQVEHSTTPLESAADARVELERARRAVDIAAVAAGLAPWRGGTPYDTPPVQAPQLAPGERYERVAHLVGWLRHGHQINATHVHVEVASRDEGVRILNASRPWLPVLLALGANSPHWQGLDTGFASWRNIHHRRWATTGAPSEFADAADYDARLAALVGVGPTVDVGTVGWLARLSERYPTIEYRLFDAQLTAADAVDLALVCRALVTALADTDPAGAAVPPELLDAALWHAARDGLEGELLHPATGALAPARDVVDALLAVAGPAAGDDADALRAGVERLLRDGTGAQRQRAALAEGGPVWLRRLHVAEPG